MLPIESLLTDVLTKGIKKVLRKKFPYKADPYISQRELDQFGSHYSHWNNVSGFLCLIPITILPVLYTLLCYYLYLLCYSLFPQSGNTFFPCQSGIFIFPALFLTCLTFTPFLRICQKALLKKQFKVYMEYDQRSEQYNIQKASRNISRIFWYPLVVSVICTYGCMLTAAPDRITYRDFPDVHAHVYKYSEIERVTFFSLYIDKKGIKSSYPQYKIFFKDGVSFKVNSYFDDFKSSKPFVSLLTSKGILLDSALTAN